MEAILLIGIQGCGKSTFFKQRFFDTHVRINLDMLRTRRREDVLVAACLQAKQPFVIDRTNVTRAGRGLFIQRAKAAGFRVVGYFFDADAAACRERNRRRSGGQVVPDAAIVATLNRLDRPAMDEGFDALYRVTVGPDDTFRVEAWPDAGGDASNRQAPPVQP